LNIDSKIINQTLKQYIPNLKAIYIFGSFAQNQQNSSSDFAHSKCPHLEYIQCNQH